MVDSGVQERHGNPKEISRRGAEEMRMTKAKKLLSASLRLCGKKMLRNNDAFKSPVLYAEEYPSRLYFFIR